jgi:isopenicillin-N N-acyltransferase-like protein
VNGDLTTDGHVLIAHNEDWTPEDEQDVAVVHACPDDGPPFLAMMYGGYLPNIGFNACGIAQCCDSVHPSDSRIGVPRVIASRAVLGTRTIADAIRCMVSPRRAAGYNHLLAHESGELYSVEVSARRFAILYAHEGYIVHTNHFIDAQLKAIEKDPDELLNTRIRRSRALNLFSLSPQHNLQSLQTIQQDHVNYPHAICNHAQEIKSWILREKTICSLIIDLTDRAMHIAWGNPCQNPYHTYFLETDTNI